MSLLDRTNSISKNSPSSLLPSGPDSRTPSLGDQERVPEHGPSSLLPDQPARSDVRQPAPDVVAVSPSELLPPAPPRFSARARRMVLIGVLASAALLLALVLTLRADEKPTPELMREAVAYFDAGRYDSAVIQLKNVLAREPQHIEANVLLGRAYMRTGALLDAEKSLLRAREVGAPPEQTALPLVQTLLELDRQEEALKELDASNTFKLPNAQSALLRGRAYLGLGRLVDAKTQFTIAATEEPAEAAAYLARVAALEGDRDGALKRIEEAIAQYPAVASLWITKGDLLRTSGDGSEALAAYRRAQSIQSDNLEAILGAAITLIAQDEFGEGGKELRKARAVSPSSHLVAFASALLAFRERRYDECRAALESVLAAAPNHMPSVLLAGTLSLALGHVEQAHDAFVHYLRRFPGNVQVRKMHAITLLRKQQPRAAIDTLAPFLGLAIRDAEVFAVAGQAYLQAGEVERAREVLRKAIAIDARNIPALTGLGLASLALGDHAAGIAELEKAIALSPPDAGPDRHLALALLARNRIDDALAAANRLEKRLPKVPEPHWIRGLAASMRGDKVAAKAHFERALLVDPLFFPAASALAEMDVARGDIRVARARYEALLERRPQMLDASLSLAQLEADHGMVDHAIARAQRLAEEHPNSLRAHVLLARIFLRSNRIDDALNAARRAREIEPRDAAAVELLGHIQLASNDAAGAVLSFNTLVNLQPRYVNARVQLIRANRAAGDRRTALAVAKEALKIAPHNESVLALLGTLLVEDGQYGEALKIAEQAKRYHPKLALGYTIEGETRLAQREAAQASSAFARGLEREDSGALRIRAHQAETALHGRDAPADKLLEWVKRAPDDVTTRVYTADVLVRLGRIPEAVVLYEEALKKSPGDVRVLNNLADALARIGDSRALDYAQEAFQRRPDDAVVAATLGSVFLSNNRLYEAVQILQKATQLAPDNAEVRFAFVKALVRAGDKVRARVELNRLLAEAKGFPQEAEARALARSL